MDPGLQYAFKLQHLDTKFASHNNTETAWFKYFDLHYKLRLFK